MAKETLHHKYFRVSLKNLKNIFEKIIRYMIIVNYIIGFKPI